MRKSLKILFTGSVLLNVILVGVLGGMAYRSWADHPWHQAKAGLSPEGRSVVARNFRASHTDIRPLKQKARDVRGDLIEIFEAEDFDEAAFDKAVRRMQGYQSDIMDRKIETMKAIAQELPADERATMAKKFVSSLERRKKNRKRKDYRWQHPHVPEAYAPDMDVTPEPKPQIKSGVPEE